MSQPEKNAVKGGLVAKLPNVQAVVFDAVGTVMYPFPSVAETYRRAIRQHCATEIDPDKVVRVVSEALTQRSRDTDLRTSESVEREFWADLVRRLCPSSSSAPEPDGFQACFDDLFDHFQRPANWRCFDDTAGLIHELHRRGLKTAIASNFDQRLNSVCDGLHELKGGDHRIISSVVGWRKPARQFFDAVSQQLDVSPDHIIFVGDDLTNDVAGAIAVGMQAAWICRSGNVTQPQGSAKKIASLQELITDSASDTTSGSGQRSASVS